MVDLPIEKRLLHYFLAMGAQPLEPLQNAPTGLTVSLGCERIHIAVLKSDAFLQKSKIIEAIMNLASLTKSANQVYLAAPRLLGTTVDAGVFRTQGIGLLLFDDRRIDETVAPQSFHTSHQEQRDQTPDPSLVTEVATLKSMYLEMERTVARLREDLKSFQQNISSTPATPVGISPPIAHERPRFTEVGAGLPSFFSNNPWIDVLSRRGREEAAPIAG
jgi:hypothetical protein